MSCSCGVNCSGNSGSALVVFFKQKTAYEMGISDWSSDVCSSYLVDRTGETGEDGVPVAVGVVDRHMPLGDGHFGRQRNVEGLREQQVGDPHMGAVAAELAQGEQDRKSVV